MKTPNPYRQTRWRARTAGQIDKGRDAHLKSMGYTVRRLPNGIVLPAPDLFVQEVVNFLLLREAEG